MSTEMENRLRAALEARAATVTSEALPSSLPAAGAGTPWWRAPHALVAVAAVCLLVLAIPIVALSLDRGTSGGDNPPDGGPASSADVAGSDGGPSEVAEKSADVDGDGKPDVVRVLAPEGDAADAMRVEAVMTQRGTQSWTAEAGQQLSIGLLADVNGVPGVEILVEVGSGPRGLRALTVGESQLGLVHEAAVASGVGSDGLTHHWWVSGERLRTSVSTTKVPEGADSWPVEATEWKPGQALALVAAPLGRYCVRSEEPGRLLACAAASSSPTPTPTPTTSPTPTPSESATPSGTGIGARPAGWPDISTRYTGWAAANTPVTVQNGAQAATVILERREGWGWYLMFHGCGTYPCADPVPWQLAGTNDSSRPRVGTVLIPLGDSVGFLVEQSPGSYAIIPWGMARGGMYGSHSGAEAWVSSRLEFFEARPRPHPLRPDVSIWDVWLWTYRPNGSDGASWTPSTEADATVLGEVCVSNIDPSVWGVCTDPEAGASASGAP